MRLFRTALVVVGTMLNLFIVPAALVVALQGETASAAPERVEPATAITVPARLVPPQCEDSVDSNWRCYIASYSEVTEVLQTMEDDCFDILTLSVAPWRIGPVEADGTAYVIEYLVTGRRSGAVCP